MKLKKFLFFILFGLIFNLGFFFIADHVIAYDNFSTSEVISNLGGYGDTGTNYSLCASSTFNNAGFWIKLNFPIEINLSNISTHVLPLSYSGSWSYNLNDLLKHDIYTGSTTSSTLLSSKSVRNIGLTTVGGIFSSYYENGEVILSANTDYWLHYYLTAGLCGSTKNIYINTRTWSSTNANKYGDSSSTIKVIDYLTGSENTYSGKSPTFSIHRYLSSGSGSICGDCVCSGGSGATTSTSTLITSEFLGGQDIGKISAISGTDESGITYTIYSYPNLLFRFILSVLGLSLAVCCLLIFFKLKK